LFLLGPFRVLQAGQPVPVRGEKTIALLCHLALHTAAGVPRDTLLAALWPERETALAIEALQSRVYSLRKLLSKAIGGAAPVVYAAGRYRLNTAAGVGVDIACFDAWAAMGDQQAHMGTMADAIPAYQHAVRLYCDDLDLSAGTDLLVLLERERVRARYLDLLMRLAEYAYMTENYATCLDYAWRLLEKDPCREDAHRLIMRYYVRCGERAQALHQYHLCEAILRREIAATPEPATVALFEQVRLDPGAI
jgi:DNA-binding SARP family transcriptional activator